MATSDFFDRIAAEGSDEDEDYDEETGEVRQKSKAAGNGHVTDSSEEDEEDDDEEAAEEVRRGFIVDEDEEDESPEVRKQRRRERRKRRREEREEDEGLDEEDLDLIGELETSAPQDSRFKRIKRGHREDRERGVDEIFSDNEDETMDEPASRRFGADEFDDFIEEDEFPDDERDQQLEDLEVSRRPNRGLAAIKNLQTSGLDEVAMEDMRAAFGDGTEYDWALEMQEGEDEDIDPDKPLELKDVFEPSQLVDRMLTESDYKIKHTDIPERYQLMREAFVDEDVSEDEVRQRIEEEYVHIAQLMAPRKNLDPEQQRPFQEAIKNVLEFINIDNFEPPFIWTHRKDYLIHSQEVSNDPYSDSAGEVRAEKLLEQSELWEIVEHDLKFRAMYEKRRSLQKTMDNIKAISSKSDAVVDELLQAAASMEEIQDIQEYIHFQYVAELKDINATQAETNGVQKKARNAATMYENVRASSVYNVVRGFGISADDFARSASEDTKRSYTDDPQDRPDDMADKFVDPAGFQTGTAVLRAAKAMFTEELTASPRLRKVVRAHYFGHGRVNCYRTDLGLKKIDEDHPYYEFKYLRSQEFASVARRPELFLRMLKAESEGLVEVQMSLSDSQSFRRKLFKHLESDNVSEVADAWNNLRREVLNMSLNKLDKIMLKNVKENLKAECEKEIARMVRSEYFRRLDQAPFKPKGQSNGTVPRVLAISNGGGVANKDPIVYAYIEDDGRVVEHGIFSDLRLGVAEKALPDAPDVEKFVQLVERRNPEVIGVSGFSVETRTLYKDIQAIVQSRDLRGPKYEDDDRNDRSDPLDVVIVNDEVARPFHQSERSNEEFPGLQPLTKYCVAIAHYLQSPILEYASLGRDIISIKFHKDQDLVPKDKLVKVLETAMVDAANMVGVDLEEAVADAYVANLLPFICGLGPRKAQHMLYAIKTNGGRVETRNDLLGGLDMDKYQSVGPKVFENCSSFVYIAYDKTEPNSNYLDNTRVHPEDYALANKIAADALEIDEEDIQAEIDEGGVGAVVRRLIDEDATDKVNDLVLEEYARQLAEQFNSRKRAVLETIRVELQDPYGELRHEFEYMSTDEVFMMLTGETRESLVENMIVPVVIKRIFSDHIEVKMDCGIEGGIGETEYPSGVGSGQSDVKAVYHPRQVLQAKMIFLNRKQLSAQFSIREDSLKRPFRREIDRAPGEWDYTQEEDDRSALAKAQEAVSGRAQRVIKHPNFHPFNSKQAEDFLVKKLRGDVVIRPSSKGTDHLAITWKVAEGVYQHIDVLELDKENEFSVGRTLKVGGRYTYSDLDELIVNHVKAMAKKVDEMTGDDRYQLTNKAQTEQWLNSYMEANPKRAMYAFCLNKDYPGFFDLCFKMGQHAKSHCWPVKIIPRAFELQKNSYPDMAALKNGFKLLMEHQMKNGRRR